MQGLIDRFPESKESTKTCKFCRGEIGGPGDFCGETHQKFYARKSAPKKYLKSCGVPERYVDASFDDYKGPAENIAKLQSAAGSCIYIHGGTGTGKTYLAASYIRYMATVDKLKGRFVTATGLFIALRQSINAGDEFAVLNDYTSRNLLVIDDIGTEKLSDYTLQSWYYIINERYNARLPTVLTSNLSLQRIAEDYGAVGDRIASRIASGRSVIKLVDKDYRLK